MENNIIFHKGRHSGLVGGLSHNLKELVYPEPGIRKQKFIVIKFLAELEEIGKRSIDRETVSHGHGSKIVDQKIHASASGELTDMYRFRVLANSQRRWLVFEVTGGAPLARHRLTLSCLMDPLFRQFKIDRARCIIGEDDETGTVLNRPFGRSRELSCGFHFGHPLKFITPRRLDCTLTAGNLPTSPRRRFGKVTSTPAIATTARIRLASEFRLLGLTEDEANNKRFEWNERKGIQLSRRRIA